MQSSTAGINKYIDIYSELLINNFGKKIAKFEFYIVHDSKNPILLNMNRKVVEFFSLRIYMRNFHHHTDKMN